MGDLYTLQPSQIILYGVAWCGDCKRARRVFAEKAVTFVDVDIDQDQQAEAFVKQVNRGNRSVPTIVFPDGTTLTEPDSLSLANKLSQTQPAA